MVKVIIKTVFIVFNILLLFGSAQDFEKKNCNPFGYLCWIFLEMIFIMVIL